MKKCYCLVATMIFFIFCNLAIANPANANVLQVASVTVTPPSQPFYSFRIFKQKGKNPPIIIRNAEHVPTALGTQTINSFLRQMMPNDHVYIVFGYYNFRTQSTKWYLESCKFKIDQPKSLNIIISKNTCKNS